MPIKICLDAGHYGKYNCSPAVKTYYESEAMWKLHLLVKAELESYGFEVITTRKDQAKNLGLQARGRTAKGCNLFLSFHSNAVGSKVNESVDYPIVYVPINGTGDTIGKLLADCITNTMGTTQKGYIKSKKGLGNYDYYGVIYGAVKVGVPGLILEHSFHTQTRATNWLLNDNNLKKLAKNEAAVIAKYYGLSKPKQEKTAYRVISGSFKIYDNAVNKYHKVIESGCINAKLIKVGEYYKVQILECATMKQAKYIVDLVKDLGLTAHVSRTTENINIILSTPKKSVEEIAKEVLTGMWGNGDERKKRLTIAGYDYEEIRTAVNKLYHR